MEKFLTYSDTVAAAMGTNSPIVILESTVIAHGLPTEAALDTALAMQKTISAAGAVPAMVGLLDGRIKIGLETTEIDYLASADDVLKISRRNFSYALSTGQPGATTVSATMMIAAAAKIPIMVTGGIGGVHRGVDNSMDISADLQELGKTNVAVVCSGAKAILDLPKTLEYLETMGVPTIGIGTDQFPAFFVASSGLPVTHRLDNVDAIAKLISTHNQLEISSGLLIANPPPPELALENDDAEGAIQQAIEKALSENISGPAVTPYLLDQVAGDTAGRSLKANQALLEANAKIGAQIARSLSLLLRTT